jgi:glycosyltransferase involved in cell wall biosynthesis
MQESITVIPTPLRQSSTTGWPHDYRIVIIAPFPPPLGGMGVQAEQLRRFLESNGVSVVSISTNWKAKGPLGFLEVVPGIRTIFHFVHFLITTYSIASPKTIFHIFSNSFGSFFLWTFTSVLICKWRRAPVIINYRGGHAEKFLQRWGKIALPVFRKADRVVVPSRFLEFVFLNHGISTKVIPNIISDKLQPERNPTDGMLHIIVNRNFEPIYNVACALRAFAIIQAYHPKARLTLIGDGSQRAQLERLVSILGLRNIMFTGQIPNQKVIETLSTADLMLNPTNVDNMPISLLEAMAVGVPIVSTNVGGVPYLIDNRVNGILVDKNDHQAMARAALRILRSARLRKRLQRNAWREVRKCRWQSVWPLWHSAYFSLMKN